MMKKLSIGIRFYLRILKFKHGINPFVYPPEEIKKEGLGQPLFSCPVTGA
jgi:hypothetical protein